MQGPGLDAYFYLSSQGDKEALEKLYDKFVSSAYTYIRLAICSVPNSHVNPKEFSNLVDNLFFKILNEFDTSRGYFSVYVDYVLSLRLMNKIKAILIERSINNITRSVTPDELDLLDNLSDPDEAELSKTVALNNFRYKISSNNNHKSAEKRTRDRILLLQYAGYTQKEICKKLNITLGVLRGYLSRMKNDDDLINLKLELK